MQFDFSVIVAILLIHWLADFVFQTDWQAKNKSTNFRALVAHTATYSLAWAYFGINFVLLTFTLHTVQDAITSRINTYLWKQNKVHWFFVSIGFDQVLHYVQLLLAYQWLVRA